MEKYLRTRHNKLLEVLLRISNDLEKNNIPWVLVGSLSLYLQGVDIEPEDIDILTTKEGALKLNTIWDKFKIKSVSFGETSSFRSYYGRFKINDVYVEVMGELEQKINDKWVSLMNRLINPVIISISGARIPVSPLENQLASYEKSNREKDIIRAEKIREALARKKSLS